jgi:threonine/homoserine/homoserine lactone efflux protein
MDGINPLLVFALTALVIEITPGPNMTYLAALSLTSGRRTGFAAVAGIALGLATYGIVAALGLAAVIDNSPLLYGILRWGRRGLPALARMGRLVERTRDLARGGRWHG